MELRDALTQLSEIHDHLARTQIFRGYRSVTTAASGLIAFMAAIAQSMLVRDSAHQGGLYVAIWIIAALLIVALVGSEIVLRCRRLGSPLQTRLTLLAVEQFVPSLVAGGLLCYVIAEFLPSLLWILPPLWMILFSLGVFASCRLLPKSTFWIGAFYLLTGVGSLALFHGPALLHPWVMGAPFTVGQLLTAAILYYKLEREHKERQLDQAP